MYYVFSSYYAYLARTRRGAVLGNKNENFSSKTYISERRAGTSRTSNSHSSPYLQTVKRLTRGNGWLDGLQRLMVVPSFPSSVQLKCQICVWKLLADLHRPRQGLIFLMPCDDVFPLPNSARDQPVHLFLSLKPY
jgi:hypothetical protein